VEVVVLVPVVAPVVAVAAVEVVLVVVAAAVVVAVRSSRASFHKVDRAGVANTESRSPLTAVSTFK
jgi:hypothetical protein